MKNKIASKILAFGIAGIMLTENVMCFPMTAQAYSRCADTWIGQLDTAKTEVNITSPLLSEQGQDIYINKSENSYQIPIFLETDAGTQWGMQVVSNHPDFLDVILTDPQNSEEEIGENLPAKYLNAYIKYPEEKEETEEIEETEGSTESTETEGDTTVEEGDTTIEGDITVEEIDTTIEIDIPTEEITMSEVEVITVGTAMTEEGGPPTEGDDTITEGDGTITEGDDTPTEGDDTQTEGDDTTTEGDDTPTEGDDTTTEGDDTTTEGDDTTTEGDDTTTEDNTTTEPVVIPEYVSAEVTLTCGNKTLKGTFFFPMRITEEMVYTGDLLTCPSIYNMETGISLVNGNVATEVYYNGGIFPAMTTYTLNNTQKVVLYDGGTMKIPANAEVQLDISQTELNVQTQTAGAETAATSMDIELTTATKNYVLSYMSEPRFKDTNAPYILSEKGMTLPVTYKLGDLEPTVFLEHLTIEDNKLMWEPAEGLSYGESEDGTFQFTAEGALAGTYRVTIFWNDNNMPVHILKTAFFIQYERLDQGGTK